MVNIGTSQEALERARSYRRREYQDSQPMTKRELFELLGIIAGAWALIGLVGVLLSAAAKAWLP